MDPVSFSGRRRVGPKTIPKLWGDIRFVFSLAAILLVKRKKKVRRKERKDNQNMDYGHTAIFPLIL